MRPFIPDGVFPKKGTFDGIFLIGILAVLLASIPRSRDSAEIK
jgi:hypothetical protein